MSQERTINTTNELLEVLHEITFPRAPLNFVCHYRVNPMDAQLMRDMSRRGWLVYGIFERPDADTGEMGIGRGRDEIVWEGATVSAVVKTAWVIFDMLVRHEMMHAFHYRGRPLFDPHATVDRLWEISDQDKVENTYAIGGDAK